MVSSTRNNIFKTKRFLKKYSYEKYKPEGNSNIYLSSFTKSIGYYLLKKIFNVKSKNFLENFIYIIADIYFGLSYSIKIIKKKKFK